MARNPLQRVYLLYPLYIETVLCSHLFEHQPLNTATVCEVLVNDFPSYHAHQEGALASTTTLDSNTYWIHHGEYYCVLYGSHCVFC